jgi:RNA polymerase sigma-70 factor (ECF subfamily)
MSAENLDTVQLHRWVERWQVGDRQAADELLKTVSARLEHLAHKMLRGYPNVQRWADTLDVLQGALIRLMHTLRNLQPTSTRAFLGLAAVHVRRELLDLARRFARRQQEAPAEDAEHVADPSAGPEGLDQWCQLHEAVANLPPEEQEVFSLTFYHGWTQPRIAELFGVDERTIRRRWQAGCLKLSQALGGRLPEA